MAVNKAPVRQQSYLTEYDRQMAEYLRRMGGSIGAQDIAAEAYGGKFPVGTMTAKILSGVLARASDKRAINREERAKDSYSRAFEIANAQDRGLNAMPGELGVDQSGNLDLLPTTALQTTDGVTNRQPYVFKDDSLNDRTYEVATNMGNYDANGNITYADDPMINQNIDRARIANQRAEAFANASPEAPLGVPYARQDVALTVGEPTGEDTTRIGRYLSGTLEQDILPTNANKALSQALRGANVNEFQFDEYRQNKRAINKPKYGELKVFYSPTNERVNVREIQNADGTRGIINADTGQILEGNYSPMPYEISDPKFEKIDGSLLQIVKGPDGSVKVKEIFNNKKEKYDTDNYLATYKGEEITVPAYVTNEGLHLFNKDNNKFELAENLSKVYTDITPDKKSQNTFTTTNQIALKTEGKLLENNIKGMNDDFDKVVNSGNIAKVNNAKMRTDQVINILLELSENDKDWQGFGASAKNKFRSAAKTLGFNVDEKLLGMIESIESLTASSIIPIAKQLGVNPTDFDYKQIEKTFASVNTSKAKNLYVMRIIQNRINQEQKMVEFLSNNRTQIMPDETEKLTFSSEESAIQYVKKLNKFEEILRNENEIFAKELFENPFGI